MSNLELKEFGIYQQVQNTEMLRKQSFLAGTARSVLSNHGGLV
jgi:hypothetical protein